jgi:CHAT domain-containing protein/Tfp pilus assembly protein PilF
VQRANALNWLGRAEHELGQLEKAHGHYEEALALLGGAGTDPLFRAKILNNLGYVLIHLDQPRAAIQQLYEALEIARKAHAVGTEVNVLNNLGSAYLSLSENHEALLRFKEAEALPSPETRAAVLNNIGQLYDSLGDQEKALSYFGQALRIDDRQRDRAAQAKTHNNMGLAEQRSAQTAAARNSFTQAVQFAKEVGDRRTEAQAVANLGYLELDLHRPDKALEQCRQALALAADDPEIEASARTAMGAAHRELGDLDAAGSELEHALTISRKRGDAVREANVHVNLARLARARGDSSAAVAQIGQAIALVESLRTRVASPDLRASFRASVQSYYELDIDSLITAGGHEALALEASERARARSFLELLDSAGTSLRQGIPSQLIERERRASDAVSIAERHRARVIADPRSDPKEVAAAVRDRDAAIETYRRVEEEVGASSPRYASLTQPLSLPKIQKLLDDQTLLLEYALGEERSYLWAVTPTEVKSYPLPPRGEIEKVARRFYEQVTFRSRDRQAGDASLARADAAVAAAAQELSQQVLAPAAGLLGNRRLLVVSDGILQYVPFAALPDPASTASYLVERHEIVSLSSASVLSVLRRQRAQRPPPPRSLAVVADPVFQRRDERVSQRQSFLIKIQQLFLPQAPRAATREESLASRDCSSQAFRRLRFSGEEAEAIAGLISPKENVYKALGFDASLPLVTSGKLSRYGLVHFATHGCIDERHPELSGLVLTLVDAQGRPQDGILWLKDIYDLNLNADLVVLSACQTALGKEIRGEGLIGLTRGFLYAGSSRVLASLWNVNDRATARLMTRFYGCMLDKEPQRAAAALRQAQLAMINDPRWSSPYYWAAFSLQGEWR